MICFLVISSSLLLLIRRLSPPQQFCVHILFVHILGVIALLMIYCTYSWTHTHICSFTQPHICCTHTHTHAHAYMQMCKHTNTITQISSIIMTIKCFFYKSCLLALTCTHSSTTWCLLKIKSESFFFLFCSFLVISCEPVNFESECLHLSAINLPYTI